MNVNTDEFSSSLKKTIICYLELRLSLGKQSIPEYRILKQLDAFLKEKDYTLTKESFDLWRKKSEHLKSGVRRNKMRIVRNFCLYHQRTEPNCFVPSLEDFPPKHQLIQPYIFTEKEIIKLLEIIKNLKPYSLSPIRSENFRLALVLLYTTGIRVSELINLTVDDYNPKQHTLLIRKSKFHKFRLLPLSEDGWCEIESLLKLRRQLKLPVFKHSPLLWNRTRKKNAGFHNGNAMSNVFRKIFKLANIYKYDGKPPRLHDIRFTFAVHALRRWYREGIDVQTKLPMLSLYMGHVSIESTAYYLRFFKDTAKLANERFERCYGTFIDNFNQ